MRSRSDARLRSPLALLAAGFLAATWAAADSGKVGGWATYRWSSSIRQEYPVVVRETGASGQTTASLSRESEPPPPIFVTYGLVRGDASSYVLQITTHKTVDGPPLSVTQVTVDRKSGKALRSVTRRPGGVVVTPESGLRPFRQADVQGREDTVAVPAGRFTAVRAPYRDGAVWVADQVPALGLVKGEFPNGTLELVKSGTVGAKDLLKS